MTPIRLLSTFFINNNIFLLHLNKCNISSVVNLRILLGTPIEAPLLTFISTCLGLHSSRRMVTTLSANEHNSFTRLAFLSHRIFPMIGNSKPMTSIIATFHHTPILFNHSCVLPYEYKTLNKVGNNAVKSNCTHFMLFGREIHLLTFCNIYIFIYRTNI